MALRRVESKFKTSFPPSSEQMAEGQGGKKPQRLASHDAWQLARYSPRHGPLILGGFVFPNELPAAVGINSSIMGSQFVHIRIPSKTRGRREKIRPLIGTGSSGKRKTKAKVGEKGKPANDDQ